MPGLIPKFVPGFRLVDGTDLNKLVDAVNPGWAGLEIVNQATPIALTVSATLTAAQLLTCLLTGNQGAAGAAAYQLPTVASLVAALPADFVNNNAFDITLSNISTAVAETNTFTTNTGWTLVGNMVVIANVTSNTPGSAGRFRIRRVSAAAFTFYRIS